MPYQEYVKEPLHLWPPGADEVREYLEDDTPSVGVTIDAMGLWTAHGNYHGTVLIEVNGDPTDLYWEAHTAGFLFIAGNCWHGYSHPDLVSLYYVLRSIYHALDERGHGKPKTLDRLLDTAADFLVKRGWVRMKPKRTDGDFDDHSPYVWCRA